MIETQKRTDKELLSIIKKLNETNSLTSGFIEPQLALLRTIRRRELRQIVPLSDTTIYEMEQRGEFPKRFHITPRCVVWKLWEVLEWVDQQQHKSKNKILKTSPHPDVYLRKTRPVRKKDQLHK